MALFDLVTKLMLATTEYVVLTGMAHNTSVLRGAWVSDETTCTVLARDVSS